ncbi:hypothetical protein [Croceicoccus estronivorus]|uniref:hypothetical protein n=1 Tax=Croceicoccus estronivorus TaxID=1172626 RepID=UPI000A884793|nr:hypothetical protein [Croceicoccus estronivorus]
MGKKIVFYELNEVPFKVFDHFAAQMPQSAVAKLKAHARAFETYAEDSGHLSPWITWPTLHRGVTNDDHGISDFGQDLGAADKEFPPIWRLLSARGIKPGVFGSLHTYPIPGNVHDYAFYVPDTFAAGPECFPAKYRAFQDFNLRMAGNNASQVNGAIAFKEASRFLANAPGMGLSARTAKQVASQLVSERLNRKRIVRRRTTQVQLAFDFYLKALRQERPDISFFFTNHVASSMHRYWPALFPADYEALKFGPDWIADWSDEIPFTMREADYQIGQLMRHVERNPDHMLIVATSMGQAAFQGRERVDRKVIITGFAKLMEAIGIPQNAWHKRPAMVPQYNVYVDEDQRARFRQNLGALSLNGQGIDLTDLGEGIFRLDFSLNNQNTLEVTFQGDKVSAEKFGITNLTMQDAAGANAYHIPEGMMLIYDPCVRADTQQTRSQISTTEIAPSILRNFDLNPPAYMQRGILL